MNGILLIDKDKDMTSHDVVNRVRRILGTLKVGHTGTLDPIATGLLPVLIGEATKISNYIVADDKEYIGTAVFGNEYTTYDITGDVLSRTDNIPSDEDVIKYVDSLKGKITQKPPIYSAIKVNGKKLYEYARAGIEVEIPEREVDIFETEVLNIKPNEVCFRVKCSTGTYIRSLIQSMGRDLSSYAAMSDLRRTKVGSFNIEEAITLGDLEKLSKEEIETRLISIEDALSDMKKFIVPDYFYDRIKNGLQFRMKKTDFNIGEEVRIYCKDEFIGIGYIRMKDTPELQLKKLIIGG